MKYPIITLPDNTEITASDITGSTVKIYVEKYDTQIGQFTDFTVMLPGNILVENHGFDKNRMEKIREYLQNNTQDILDYIEEKESCRI